MDTVKEGLLKRSATNGTKSAEALHKRDYATSKWFADDVTRMCRSYPEYAGEIRLAYDTAYKAEASSYQLSPNYFR